MDRSPHLALSPEQSAIIDWFATNARDLPWRAAECTPWGVLVSEIMLQQTPVVRVLPRWQEWLERWPTPAALAAEPSGEAVRAWGRLGYPRRALRLHAAALRITEEYDGEVPGTVAELKSLPGIGDYTAAAVAAFAFGVRATVVDTNIRRVEARLFSGLALPAPTLNAAEMALAESLLPLEATNSVRWNAASMELGALLCTARSPQCALCPVRASCAWIAAGEPEPIYRPKGQPWAGTDRQLRGAVMAVLRATDSPTPWDMFFTEPVLIGDAELSRSLRHLHALESENSRLERILQDLLQEGLAQRSAAGLSLPG
ncbi:A/G-specific adenine glycosylase [Psychromicrobium silvestre]|uniref:Adenine DNA glycosylase n=1 Tax=Psychromicrobium silvestre TaxID=1645614 RepID=A0A7Y9S831_9MICC|nr:A/G-specific adenine glycosylase [Psychromicrobium silvestre]NYE96080.1 A/G-specific adenine glycosylase [Psychromicrobium silvestre]